MASAGPHQPVAAPVAPGVVTELARATADIGEAARRQPRAAIYAFTVLASLTVVLGFVYLMFTRPDRSAASAPIPTTGNWVTIGQLEERDKRLALATDATVRELKAELKASIDSIRVEFAAASGALSEQAKALIEGQRRMETHADQSNQRIDRLYEKLILGK